MSERTKYRRYSYSQINSDDGEFRLFELAAGAGDTPIQGVLLKSNTGSAPVYSTVSYCWGTSLEQERIQVESHYLNIPTNAATTLRRVRHRDHSLLIWMDSICICQSNDDERGGQVRKMCDIYSAAECNFIYLGAQDMSQALAEIASINAEVMVETEGYAALAEYLRPSGKWRSSLKPLTKPIFEQHLDHFFGLAWFHRVWVVQEAALARRNICLCGPTTIDLLPVVRAGVWLQHKQHFIKLISLKRAINRVFGLFDLVDHEHGWYATHPHQLHQLLRMSSALLCTLPVDRVFGVLGILQRYNAPEWRSLKTDYSTPLEEVFELACRTSITVVRGDLYPISTVSHTRPLGEFEKKPALPSWVPDWTVVDDHPLLTKELSGRFDACDGSVRSGELDDSTSSTQGVLIVSGIVVGCVSSLGPVITFDMVSEEGNLLVLADLLEAWISLVFDTAERRAAALNCLPAVLTGGENSTNLSEPTNGMQSWPDFRELLATIFSDPVRSKLTGYGNAITQQQVIGNLHPNIIDTCTNRRLCVTSTGMVGLGPWLLSKDDIGTVLDGLSWPAFLRPGQQDNRYHQFLGVGYLHDVMDGSWARQQRLTGCESCSFSLK